MCDTWIALRDATLDGKVIFAKNSDRPIFDCQPLLLRPRQEWTSGSLIQTGYVTLPQVETTYAHLGSSPYWCWGYEEGMNEWGLAIGNEAIYTRPLRDAITQYRQGRPVQPGLLGMDLIRLALERCTHAAQAVELMGQLVETYGCLALATRACRTMPAATITPSSSPTRLKPGCWRPPGGAGRRGDWSRAARPSLTR
jgi:secernin